MLRLLAALGVLTEPEPRSFDLTVLGDRLRSDVPASMRNWAMLADTVGFDAYEPILDAARTGKTGLEIAYGVTTFERLHGDPQRAARFDATMSERTAAFAPSVAAAYDFAGMRVITDIGGGQGTLLAAILRRHEHLRGVVFEVPRRSAPGSPCAARSRHGGPLRDSRRGLLRRRSGRCRRLHPGQRAA